MAFRTFIAVTLLSARLANFGIAIVELAQAQPAQPAAEAQIELQIDQRPEWQVDDQPLLTSLTMDDTTE